MQVLKFSNFFLTIKLYVLSSLVNFTIKVLGVFLFIDYEYDCCLATVDSLRGTRGFCIAYYIVHEIMFIYLHRCYASLRLKFDFFCTKKKKL